MRSALLLLFVISVVGLYFTRSYPSRPTRAGASSDPLYTYVTGIIESLLIFHSCESKRGNVQIHSICQL